MKKKVIAFSLFTVLLGIYVFFAAPNLSPLYFDGAIFWLFVVTIYIAIGVVTSYKIPKFSVDENTKRPHIEFDNGKMPKKWLFISIGSLWAICIAVFLIFNPLFFWGSYRDQMAEPEVKEFTSEVQAVDQQQIPVVDEDLAATLADKKLGEKPALGSQVKIGTPTIQNVDGELTWVVPLQHSGVFKWFANMDGSAGYIKVSATNLSKVEYVDSYKIKIQPDTAYLMDDLSRTARFKGGLFTGITDYSFEIDDSGKPYWVVTTYKNTCGFNLPEADGVILVDAQTGSTQKYNVDNVPSWIDRVQPESYINAQINNKGKYIHGIFNFSNKEKFQTSTGSNIVYNNGKCYYFTGITSVGVDESATGFMMVDMVTKKPILYRMSGATESAGKSSAEGKVQDLGYKATEPIILNINSQPTYFMTLKDSARLIKKYAFVNVKDYMIVGVGDTMTEALNDYTKATLNISNKVDISGENNAAVKSVNGTIDRIDSAVVDGKTIFTFTLKETPQKFFRAHYEQSSSLAISRTGDSVKITYLETDSNVIDITEFSNISVFSTASSADKSE